MTATKGPAPLEPEEDQEPLIEHLREEELRDRIRTIDDEMAKWRAKLSLLLNAAVQYELNKVAGDDGVEVIASVVGIHAEAIWPLLAGSYRATPTVWMRLERILMLCHASEGVERVTTARGYFDRLLDLTAERDRALNRRVELSRRKRGKEAGIGATRVPEPEKAPGDSTDPPVTPPAIPDLRGHDQRPDPLLADTPEGFVAAMRAYHAWAGNPSLREMERRCAKQISYSTFRTMLNGGSLPAKLASVETFVRVLGGTTEDLQRWATAWRRIAMNGDEAGGGDRQSNEP
ncbi:hypothetical protein [Actinomadura sp. DC4]|uniref:hypothetical protein n=1 Tax=Actinomadura sp. DC4 TaxID=3055069 RepID=UPI0025AFED34|nr:hypothetical protein [Actinomadura sp. DC4]MDN3357349.1 hypothetical protein [Actinomadura sp. DC4]